MFVCASPFSFGCARSRVAPAGFPGLAINASCVGGQLKLASGDENYPGERAFWAERHLRETIGLEPLPCLGPTTESYQFTWTSALSPTEPVIRITRNRSESIASLFYKRRDGSNVVSSEHLQLADRDWERLTRSLFSLGFWTEPSRLMPKPDAGRVLDGTALVIEGYYGGRYHVLAREGTETGLAELRNSLFDVVRPQKISRPSSPLLGLLEGQRDGWYHAVSRESTFLETDFHIPARTMFEVAGLEAPAIVRARP